jgi:hypothetical protein
MEHSATSSRKGTLLILSTSNSSASGSSSIAIQRSISVDLVAGNGKPVILPVD